jgi:hypothetical protein
MLPEDLEEKIEWKRKKDEETMNATTVGRAATTLPTAQRRNHTMTEEPTGQPKPQ